MLRDVAVRGRRARPPPARHVEQALDAHRIAPGLYQGSKPPEGPVLHYLGFSAVALCAFEHQPRPERFERVELLYAPLDDDRRPPTREEWDTARAASRGVARRLLEGRRVLVTCSMGLNRSGLVVALTLLRLAPPGRFGPEDAIRLVQTRRPGALRNPYFVDAILAVERVR